MAKYSLCKKGNLSLGVKLEVDEFGNDIYFQHPFTGQWCENLDQVFSGWCEQSEKENERWIEFTEAIKKDDMLSQKICDEIEIIEY